MDDHKLLEELRAQRELIRKHLQWLDSRIAGLAEQKEPAPEDDSPNPGKTQRSSVDETEKDETPEASDRGEPDDGVSPDETLSNYDAPAGNDLAKVKLGCLVLLILGVVGFLFLLFGLPYLIY